MSSKSTIQFQNACCGVSQKFQITESANIDCASVSILLIETVATKDVLLRSGRLSIFVWLIMGHSSSGSSINCGPFCQMLSLSRLVGSFPLVN